MVNSNGRPYFEGEKEANQAYTCFVPPELEEVFNNLMRSQMVVQAGATASSSNYTRDAFAGVSFEVLETLTDANDFYLRRDSSDASMRPFASGVHASIERDEWRMDNSDEARETLHTGIRARIRKFYGNANPFAIIKQTAS